jgi:hypothetical protein
MVFPRRRCRVVVAASSLPRPPRLLDGASRAGFGVATGLRRRRAADARAAPARRRKGRRADATTTEPGIPAAHRRGTERNGPPGRQTSPGPFLLTLKTFVRDGGRRGARGCPLSRPFLRSRRRRDLRLFLRRSPVAKRKPGLNAPSSKRGGRGTTERGNSERGNDEYGKGRDARTTFPSGRPKCRPSVLAGATRRSDVVVVSGVQG